MEKYYITESTEEEYRVGGWKLPGMEKNIDLCKKKEVDVSSQFLS
jgi:hypothetical protein